MLLGHILPERVFAVEHAGNARLNQQAQGADPLLTREQEIAQIAAAQQRQIIMKLQFLAEDLQMLTAKQRRPRLTNLIDIGLVIRRIAHRHDDVYRIAKLLINSLQRGNMFIAAIP